MDRSDRERVERIDRTDRGVRDDRSYSHDAREIYPDERTIRSRGYSNGTRETPRAIREMVPTPSLQGGEDVWNDALREYQKQREVEALEIAELARSHVHGMYQAVDRSHNYQVSLETLLVMARVADVRPDKMRFIVTAKPIPMATTTVLTPTPKPQPTAAPVQKTISSLLQVTNHRRRSRKSPNRKEKSNPLRSKQSCSTFSKAIPPLPSIARVQLHPLRTRSEKMRRIGNPLLLIQSFNPPTSLWPRSLRVFRRKKRPD